MYSIGLALLWVLMPEGSIPTNQDQACLTPEILFHKAPKTIFSITVIVMLVLIVSMQLLNFLKLWKRLQMSIGSVPSGPVPVATGRNRIYKRAMVTSSMIATAYLIGWLPCMICMIIYDWSNVDKETLENALQILGVLGALQSFANPIIFRLRNMDIKICRRAAPVPMANHGANIPVANHGANIPMANLGQNLPEIDV